MEYIRVAWSHEFDNEPIEFYSEIGDDRYEVRKVQVYRDGRREWAAENRETDTAFLAEAPFPSIDEIAEQADLRVWSISAEEFEREWDAATSSRSK
ncbi:hypothetical protein [Nocardia sp. NPDC050793]|uniref:DUF6881 domain-containing protein n=1 Tax=Nocardia sp. NPDC050793 TaxID=3155159 RepID=UPI0034086BB7